MLLYFPQMPGLERITCVLLGRIGDAITATPFFDAVRARYPDAQLRFVLSSSCRGLSGLIAPGGAPAPADDFRWVPRWGAAFVREAADVVVDLNPAPSKSAAAVVWLSDAKDKVGFRKKRLNGVFTRQIDEPREDEPMLERYGRLAAALGARDYRPLPRVALGDDKARARSVLDPLGFADDGAMALALHPGNFKKFDNRWPEDNFVALADRLLDDPRLRLFYLAGPGEQAQVEAIARAAKRPIAVVAPGPLRQTSGVLQNMAALVCNITGTTHLAHAVGVPTFGLYSGYTNAVWRPRHQRCGGVAAKDWESCRSLGVDEVHAGLRQFLAEFGKE